MAVEEAFNGEVFEAEALQPGEGSFHGGLHTFKGLAALSLPAFASRVSWCVKL